MFDEAVKFIATIRAVNTSDAKRLLGHFGSIVMISKASADALAKCPGLGATKADNIYRFFHSNLVVASSLPTTASAPTTSAVATN